MFYLSVPVTAEDQKSLSPAMEAIRYIILWYILEKRC